MNSQSYFLMLPPSLNNRACCITVLSSLNHPDAHAVQSHPRQVWRRMLSKSFLNADPRDSRLLATEAPLGPLVLQEAANEVCCMNGFHCLVSYNEKALSSLSY